jgi:hypothetical protein
LKLEDIESGTTGDQEETGGDRQPVRQGEPW